MLDPKQEILLRRNYFIAAVISVSMILSVFFYGVAVHSAAANVRVPEEGQGTIRFILYAMAVSCLGLGPFSQKVLLTKRGKPSPADLSEVAFARLVSKKLVTAIISNSLCETAAVFGLLLFFTTGNVVDFYTLAILALAGLLLQFPRYEQWKNFAQTASGRN